MYDQNEIGNRLRKIRDQFLIGIKISTSQFAELLGEPKHNIAAYEAGKANIPNRVFVALYEKGINPNYILTGEGPVYSPNKAGNTLNEAMKDKIESFKISDSLKIPAEDSVKQKIIAKAAITAQNQVSNISKLDASNLSVDELLLKAEQFNAAAGDIMKIVNQKKNK